jgi:hypothetical protein
MEAQVYGQFMNQRKLQNNSEELNEGKEGFREQVGRRGKRTGRCIEIEKWDLPGMFNRRSLLPDQLPKRPNFLNNQMPHSIR